MAYEEGLAQRIREALGGDSGAVDEKRMFGGLCFMVSGHMCVGVVGDTLMARVGPDAYEACLARPHVREMDFTGRAMRGMVYVAPEGLTEDADLDAWVARCLDFVRTLPPRVR